MHHKRATVKAFNQSQDLRHELTEVESKLWAYLRSHRFYDIHFRRQHAIGKYIADFCAPRIKLIIEVDGSQHLDQEIPDQERTEFLARRGYHVLRFWNQDVLNNLDEVIRAIDLEILNQRQKN
jgi:very-short-patch-repair endonuclease